MLAELRKYGVGLILANQFTDQIDVEVRNAILGNIGTLVVFRVGSIDAERLVKELWPKLDPYELTLLPNRMFWIRPLVKGQSTEAFTGETITIRPGRYDDRAAELRPQAPRPPRRSEPEPFEPEDLGD